MEIKALWPLTQELMYAFGPFYQDAMGAAIREIGVQGAWFPLALARGAHPEPLTLERMRLLNPYTRPERLSGDLEKLAGLDLLERVGADAYVLTDLGRERVETVFEAAHRALGDVPMLPEAETHRLAELLERAARACLDADQPAEKWSLRYSRWTDPGPAAPLAGRIDQHLTDLSRFRDDAHTAAWQPLGVSGPAWEALTFLWREGIDTPEGLAERVPYREYDPAAYAEFFDELVAHGWAAAQNGGYAITDQGRAVRQEAEDATEAFFAAGWAALSDEDLAELGDLMARARDTLVTIALRQIWELAGEVTGKIFETTRPVVVPPVEKYALDRRGDMLALIVARQAHPESVDTSWFAVRTPYNHSSGWQATLERLAEEGWLQEAGEGTFRLSERAEAVLDEIEGAFYEALGEIPEMPEQDLERLAGLLERLVEASLKAEAPKEKPRVKRSHAGRSPLAEAPLARVDRALDDLNAFRDDSHISAWRANGVDAATWEAFTYVVREQAGTPEALAEALAHRNHAVETYREALDLLVARGWLQPAGEAFQATEEGRQVHQLTEERTDRAFFGPWSELNGTEVNGLRRLLVLLKEDLQEKVPEPAHGT